MAINPQTLAAFVPVAPPPLPAVIEILDPAKQAAVLTAENGRTTSEWLVVLGSAGTLLTGVLGVLNVTPWHLGPDQVDAITKLGAEIAAVASAYIISRGVRKAGTPG